MGASRIDADAEARRELTRVEPPVNGREPVRRIFGRHPALERVPRARDRLLRRHTGGGTADAGPGGDPKLSLDDVDTGDFLGDGVLDLQARVDLDEVERPGVGVQEELDGPRVRVVSGPRQGERRVAEGPSLGLGQGRRRRPLDELLMPPLNRAIALEQVDQVSVEVAQDLDLDVVRPAQHSLGVHEVLAEGRARFAPRRLDQLGKLRRRLHHAQAPTAPTATGLDHEGIADGRREVLRLSMIARERAGRGQHGHPHRLRQRARRDLVAERAQHLGARTDEGDARLRAG